MGIVLYPRDEREYGAVCRLQTEKSLADVVKPTGTGKSFIVFELIVKMLSLFFVAVFQRVYLYNAERECISNRDRVSVFSVRYVAYAKFMRIKRGFAAFTAGDSATRLIIDVVNNFESLCSIDSIWEEMEIGIQQYRLEGQGDEIVTDRF